MPAGLIIKKFSERRLEMQKTAKKFLSMLLALMMVLSILPTAVFATEQGTVAAPLDSIVPYGANDQTTGTATISV